VGKETDKFKFFCRNIMQVSDKFMSSRIALISAMDEAALK
jgi:hypothetical protein